MENKERYLYTEVACEMTPEAEEKCKQLLATIKSQELKQELGNAIIAYGRVLTRAYHGLETPGFENLQDCMPSELQHKMQILKDFYEQL